MSDFHITFANPWLLFLLVPAFAVTLIWYFKINKKYRRTRNRIISVVLHLVVTLIATTLLAGMRFEYKVANQNNEIILLVDVSESENFSEEERDEFVGTVLNQSRFDNYKVGVVTFGFDQKYAVPLTYDVNGIFSAYVAADLPDRSASNIEDALNYTAGLFSNPESAKIVLITDGLETDGRATSVVRSIKASGINVDVAEISGAYGEDVVVVGVEKPEYHIGVGTENAFTALLSSKTSKQVVLNFYDGEDNKLSTQIADLSEGENRIVFNHTFTTDGVHDLIVEAEVDGESDENSFEAKNNVYHSFINIEIFNKVLIIERNEGESQTLVDILTEKEEFVVEVVSASDDEHLPLTVDGLRLYDQVILCNIAYEDLPEDYDKKLYDYVNEFGGGLFTVGGDKDPDMPNSEANAYSRDDLYGTVLQRLLPVQAIDYTPPLGVVVIVDTSGSMNASDNNSSMSRLEWAKEGAYAAMRSLSERDYFGLMTLDDDYHTILSLTPRTQESEIVNAIEHLENAMGATVFPGAINRAGEELRALKNVDKKHIIIVTDGEVPAEQTEDYQNYISHYFAEDGITLSVIMINSGNRDAEAAMQAAVDLGGGKLYVIKESSTLVSKIKSDLSMPMITEVEYKTFYPTIADMSSPLVKDLGRNEADGKNDQLDITLDGFYGVKAKAKANVILKGEFDVPIYAQWRFGKGMVGSLMVDVSGKFAKDFTKSVTGKQFIKNAIENLMPAENIRATEISYTLRESNYTNNLSVYATLEEGEKIEGKIEEVFGDAVISLNEITPDESRKGASIYVSSALGADNAYTRASFIIKNAGIYKVTLNKINEEGTLLSSVEFYKEFSYSKEYVEPTQEEILAAKENMAALAIGGGGAVIEDLEDPSRQIFGNFITVLDRVIDPTLFLAILSIVLFLLDICVRKFKFKWIHEIIRERKNKRA